MNLRSPFPGMDPYLEEHWGDVHTRFMVYASNQLNSQLPGDLQARVEEGLAVEADDDTWRTIYPDVSVIEAGDAATHSFVASPTSAAVAEPIEVALPRESPIDRHIEIVDLSENRLVTVIELLSPSNKIGEAGRAKYRRKQADYMKAGVNLVEIDLLRAGGFVLAIPDEFWPHGDAADYKICIRRLSKPNVAGTLGIKLRQSLPNIPIPLRRHDPDVVLELQPLIDECYRDGRYAKLDYGRPPTPPLSKDDQAWAEELIQARMRGESS